MITPAISVLSAVEGLKVIDPEFEDFIVPITAVIIVGAVLRATSRHGSRRPVLRAGDDRVVRRDRRVRRERHRRQPGDPQGALADLCADIHRRALSHRFLRPRRDRARGHRRGGAVRRHGALRSTCDHVWLARTRPTGLHAELFRPGRAGAARRSRGGCSVLSADPGVGANSDGAAGHCRDGDRVSGGDHRGVLGGIASRPARLPAEAPDRAHVGVDHRPDLRAVDQRGADGRGFDPRLRVPQFCGAGVRVRHGGDGHDHHHHHAVLLLRTHEVAMAAVAGADRRRRAGSGGSDVLRGEPHETRARCVAATAHRHHRLHGDDDLETRP